MTKSSIQTFQEDCIDLLRERTEGRPVHRRSFLSALAVLGVSPALFRLTPAHAQAKEIVVVNFGGDAVPAMTKAWADPFNKTSAIKAVIDGAVPTSAKMKAMVESGKVTWSVVDRNLIAALELGRQNLLEKIDYSIVDKSKVRPEHAGEWGIGSYIYSNVLAYQVDAFGGRVPKTWADFYNLKDFPGKRTMRKHIDGQLETALLADGVAPDKLYPLDVKRAFAKIATIKKDLLFWNSGSESQSLMRDGECVMGLLWHTRANVLADETQGRVTYTFKDGLLQPGLWVVPKGNPAGKEAMRAIASMQQPEGQVKLLAAMGNGPSNPAADALVPADLKKKNPSDAANAAIQAKINAEWYKANHSKTFQSFLDLISS